MEKSVREVDIDAISPNLRLVCSEDAMEELARDIRLRGQREPILVSPARGSFRIIDGEKRWRACKRLGMSSIRVAM